MKNFDDFANEDWIEYAFAKGYDDCLNGYSLSNEPIDDGNHAELAYRKGFLLCIEENKEYIR